MSPSNSDHCNASPREVGEMDAVASVRVWGLTSAVCEIAVTPGVMSLKKGYETDDPLIIFAMSPGKGMANWSYNLLNLAASSYTSEYCTWKGVRLAVV